MVKIHEFESCSDYHDKATKYHYENSGALYPPKGEIVILPLRQEDNVFCYEVGVSGKKCYGMFWYLEDARKIAELIQKGEL